MGRLGRRDEAQGTRQEGRGIREEAQGTRQEGRGIREEGQVFFNG
jgi:hypothetical protein